MESSHVAEGSFSSLESSPKPEINPKPKILPSSHLFLGVFKVKKPNINPPYHMKSFDT
jgi:hypothetical protein